jgi:Domain of unknown function (DUF4350)
MTGRALLACGGAVVALLLTPLAALAQGPGDVENDALDGASALRQLAEANGHHTTLMTDQFKLPAGPGVVFILEPESGFRTAEAQDVVRWVAQGGVLVYASATHDQELETVLDISRASDTGDFASVAHPATPLLAGANNVVIGSLLPFATPTQTQTIYLRASNSEIAGLEGSIGRGHFFALASTYPLNNQLLDNQDDGALAADFIAAAGPGAAIAFDQFHHGGGGGQTSSLAWIGTPWGLAIVLEVLLVFVLLAIRGRGFGPMIPLRPVADPSSAEFTSAVGAMLRRARASRPTVARLLLTTRSALAGRVGIRGGSGALDEVLKERAPALADALASATARAAAVQDDGSLAEAAAELHRLARPALSGTPTNQPTTRN